MKSSLLNIIKFLYYLVGIPGIVLFFFELFHSDTIIMTWVTTFLAIYMYWVILIWITKIEIPLNWIHKKISIYQWLDSLTNHDESLIYPLCTQKVKYTTLENLLTVKNSFIKTTHGNKGTLKLYKAYYRQLSNENSDQVYWTALMTLFSSMVILLVREYILKNSIKLSIVESSDYFLLIMLIVTTIAYMVVQIQRNKKRYGLITDILDICIEEIEEKKDKDK
ncbi:hypothetical protein SAMN05192533_11769 [Mesobacillus persicus]|uniref:Uncharacterized protein n=1 Tax=Mesobacillus persicus TaxID=930146 RepID=A0A1H8IJS1_9BACI|nr:hypothetical protein [Mesobacillus persicus]SEN68542.1 hypothetical protein SAMN05192533_11769 [Mesobacillus persicus]